MAECLPTSGVLLMSVDKGHIGSLLHIIQRTITGGGMLDKRAAEGGIHEMEWFAMATISSGGESIFPRATEEVKGDHTEIENCLGSGLVVGEGKASHQRVENGDIDGPDSGGGWIRVGPCLEEGL
jgi:hypothetical protein